MGMLKPFVDMVRGIGPNKQNHTTEHKEPAIPEGKTCALHACVSVHALI